MVRARRIRGSGNLLSVQKIGHIDVFVELNNRAQSVLIVKVSEFHGNFKRKAPSAMSVMSRIGDSIFFLIFCRLA